MQSYINHKLSQGYAEAVDVHIRGGFILRRMGTIAQTFGTRWLQEINDCGIQDQITMFFVKQEFNDFMYVPSETAACGRSTLQVWSLY